MKRLISLILCFVMLIMTFSFNVTAAEEEVLCAKDMFTYNFDLEDAEVAYYLNECK